MDTVLTVTSAITFVCFLILAVTMYKKKDGKYPRLWVVWAALLVLPLARFLTHFIPMSNVGGIVVYGIAIAIMIIGAFIGFTGGRT